MKIGIRPGTEKRCALMRYYLDNKYSHSEVLKQVGVMRGKPEKEKEQIAESILADLQAQTEK